MKKEEEKLKYARHVAEAWQTLYYEGLISEKKSDSIFKKIKTKYGDILKLHK